MSAQEKNLIREVLDRVKEIEGVEFDKEVATPLRMSERNLASYKERGSMPWEQLKTYALWRGVSLEWLVNGTGPIRREELNGVGEPRADYQARCLDIDLLSECIASVDRFLETSRRDLPADKRARIVGFLYEQSIKSDQLQDADLPNLVALAS